MLTRRQVLRLGAGALLARGFWPGAVAAADAERPGGFAFAVVSDLHAVDQKCSDWLEGVVKGMRQKERPAFCLLAGDLAEHGKATQLALVRDVFKGLAAPVQVVCGNHDWVTNADRKPYEELLPRALNYHF